MESLKKLQTKCQMTLTYFIAKKIIVIHLLLPCFPDNKTGLELIFTPKYGTRAYFQGMYYFDISKNEVTK